MLEEEKSITIDKKHLKLKEVGKGTYEGEWKDNLPHGYGV